MDTHVDATTLNQILSGAYFYFLQRKDVLSNGVPLPSFCHPPAIDRKLRQRVVPSYQRNQLLSYVVVGSGRLYQRSGEDWPVIPAEYGQSYEDALDAATEYMAPTPTTGLRFRWAENHFPNEKFERMILASRIPGQEYTPHPGSDFLVTHLDSGLVTHWNNERFHQAWLDGRIEITHDPRDNR